MIVEKYYEPLVGDDDRTDKFEKSFVLLSSVWFRDSVESLTNFVSLFTSTSSRVRIESRRNSILGGSTLYSSLKISSLLSSEGLPIMTPR